MADLLFAFGWVLGVIVGVPASILLAVSARTSIHNHTHTHHTTVNVTVLQSPPPRLAGTTQAQLSPAQVVPLLTASTNRVLSVERPGVAQIAMQPGTAVTRY